MQGNSFLFCHYLGDKSKSVALVRVAIFHEDKTIIGGEQCRLFEVTSGLIQVLKREVGNVYI